MLTGLNDKLFPDWIITRKNNKWDAWYKMTTTDLLFVENIQKQGK